ncbi:MAG TPA: hypothetical protein VGC80_02350, partial [Acetobacteraceae bacterium]
MSDIDLEKGKWGKGLLRPVDRKRISPEVRVIEEAFWTPFLASLRLDDPNQQIPKPPGPVENKRFSLPMETWLTAFRATKSGWPRVGVQFRTRRNAAVVWRDLAANESAIRSELPPS